MPEPLSLSVRSLAARVADQLGGATINGDEDQVLLTTEGTRAVLTALNDGRIEVEMVYDGDIALAYFGMADDSLPGLIANAILCNEADVALAHGKTRRMSEVLADMEKKRDA
jgi:hypothetical protein